MERMSDEFVLANPFEDTDEMVDILDRLASNSKTSSDRYNFNELSIHLAGLYERYRFFRSEVIQNRNLTEIDYEEFYGEE